MASVVFRRAQPQDYSAILRLQSKNFIGNPAEEQRNEGFLSAEFSPDQPLSSYNSYIYGPVCIDRAYRRRGLLRGLCDTQKQDLAGQFDMGVAFVARSNPHSLDAHIAGLGMTEVGDFELKGNVYVILAFRVAPASLS